MVDIDPLYIIPYLHGLQAARRQKRIEGNGGNKNFLIIDTKVEHISQNLKGM
jgi:hypothetical protein